SLGSGTRVPRQDAIARDKALVHHSNVGAAFDEYESVRRPASSHFQDAAGKSLDWYENVGEKMHLDPVSFAYDYMRRTDKVSHDELKQRDPHFVAAYEELHRAQV